MRPRTREPTLLNRISILTYCLLSHLLPTPPPELHGYPFWPLRITEIYKAEHLLGCGSDFSSTVHSHSHSSRARARASCPRPPTRLSKTEDQRVGFSVIFQSFTKYFFLSPLASVRQARMEEMEEADEEKARGQEQFDRLVDVNVTCNRDSRAYVSWDRAIMRWQGVEQRLGK